MQAIVKISYFDVTQNVYITEDGKKEPTVYQVAFLDIPNFLVDLDGLETVHIFGREDLLDRFINKIKEKEFTKYKCNKMNIMLNK